MKPRLLIAEDHALMRAKIASLLQRDFDVVASVAGGPAAVEATSQLVPDVVILDVSMPVLDGPDVAKLLKSLGCNAKIIFISVSRDLNQITACLASGGDAYVSKMRMGTDLIYAIAEVLAGRRFVSPDVCVMRSA
jgi:DNA-binding NarL/FixJ family response regulator